MSNYSFLFLKSLSPLFRIGFSKKEGSLKDSSMLIIELDSMTGNKYVYSVKE